MHKSSRNIKTASHRQVKPIAPRKQTSRHTAKKSLTSTSKRSLHVLRELPAGPLEAVKQKMISEEQLDYHHDKHHRAYVNNLNQYIKDKAPELDGKTLQETIAIAHETGNKFVFNQAAQIVNHDLFWDSIAPKVALDESKHSKLITQIKSDFGSVDEMKNQLKAAGKTHFGSGWAFLVKKDGKLSVKGYHDADTPVAHGEVPIIALDVWEHAFYVDHRNRKPAYVDSFVDDMINWDFAQKQLDV